jgi:hypothetical protein
LFSVDTQPISGEEFAVEVACQGKDGAFAAAWAREGVTAPKDQYPIADDI